MTITTDGARASRPQKQKGEEAMTSKRILWLSAIVVISLVSPRVRAAVPLAARRLHPCAGR